MEIIVGQVSEEGVTPEEAFVPVDEHTFRLDAAVGILEINDELDVGLFLKRARVCMQILGDASFHRDRYASLSGY